MEFWLLPSLAALPLGGYACWIYRSFYSVAAVVLLMISPYLYLLGGAVIMTRKGCISGLHDYPALERMPLLRIITFPFVGTMTSRTCPFVA